MEETRKLAKLKGWGPEQTNWELTVARTRVHKAVVEAMLAKDQGPQARDYLNAVEAKDRAQYESEQTNPKKEQRVREIEVTELGRLKERARKACIPADAAQLADELMKQYTIESGGTSRVDYGAATAAVEEMRRLGKIRSDLCAAVSDRLQEKMLLSHYSSLEKAEAERKKRNEPVDAIQALRIEVDRLTRSRILRDLSDMGLRRQLQKLEETVAQLQAELADLKQQNR